MNRGTPANGDNDGNAGLLSENVNPSTSIMLTQSDKFFFHIFVNIF